MSTAISKPKNLPPRNGSRPRVAAPRGVGHLCAARGVDQPRRRFEAL